MQTNNETDTKETMNAAISVLILTKNEGQDLPDCLESVKWSDDVHVYDSFSEDGTVAIAKAMGATVTQRAFEGYASQRNAALHGLEFRHPWVLILDADERVPLPLARQMSAFVVSPMAQDITACRMRRRDFFLGTWLKHAQISPFYIRLVRPGKVRYEREINEALRVDGSILDLSEAFDHYPFSKGMHRWLEKHNIYSSMEAQIIADRQGRKNTYSITKAFFCHDFNQRRIHQKAFFYRLPFRPLIKWLYVMFVRGAILDGRAGITYAFLQSIYEYMIVLKTRELIANQKSQAKSL